jgi:hypothetical protein
VWARFRGAADRFFERYHHRHEIGLAAKLAEREAVVVELEALAAADEAPTDLPDHVQRIRATWSRSVPVPVPGMKLLADRWQAALGLLLSSRPDAFVGSDLDPSAIEHKMEKLVLRVEALANEANQPPVQHKSQAELLAAKLRSALASNAMGGRAHEESKSRAAGDAVRDAQTAWQRLPPIDTPEARGYSQRFREACRKVTGGGSGRQHGAGASPQAQPQSRAPRTERPEPATV